MTSALQVHRQVWRARACAACGSIAGAGLLLFVVTILGRALDAGPTNGRRGLVLLLAAVLVLLAVAAARAARVAWRRGAWLEGLEREWILQERRRELGIEPELSDAVLAEIQREKLELARGRGWRVPTREEVRAIESRWRGRAARPA